MTNRLDGKRVMMLGEGTAADALAAAFRALGAQVPTGAATPPIDIAVIAVVDPGGLSPMPFGELDEGEWVRRCEAPLDAVRRAFVDALAAMEDGDDGTGGSIFVLIPSIALSGAPDLVPYSALGEGARLMAKAIARAEGERGITVNCLALAPELLNPGGRSTVQGRVPPALAAPTLQDIAAHIASLTAGPPIMTGATVVLDGGDYMWV